LLISYLLIMDILLNYERFFLAMLFGNIGNNFTSFYASRYYFLNYSAILLSKLASVERYGDKIIRGVIMGHLTTRLAIPKLPRPFHITYIYYSNNYLHRAINLPRTSFSSSLNAISLTANRFTSRVGNMIKVNLTFRILLPFRSYAYCIAMFTCPLITSIYSVILGRVDSWGRRRYILGLRYSIFFPIVIRRKDSRDSLRIAVFGTLYKSNNGLIIRERAFELFTLLV
jgi:hypothetical protein